MILHTQWNSTLIADGATGVEDFYSLKEIETVKHYSTQCQFFTKIIIVINPVCECTRMSAEDDFQRLTKGEWGDVCT